jgi:hypothetical protein
VLMLISQLSPSLNTNARYAGIDLQQRHNCSKDREMAPHSRLLLFREGALGPRPPGNPSATFTAMKATGTHRASCVRREAASRRGLGASTTIAQQLSIRTCWRSHRFRGGLPPRQRPLPSCPSGWVASPTRMWALIRRTPERSRSANRCTRRRPSPPSPPTTGSCAPSRRRAGSGHRPASRTHRTDDGVGVRASRAFTSSQGRQEPR